MEKLHEFKDETIYRFSCDCYIPGHALDVSIHKEHKLVGMIMWQETNSFEERLKWIWKMLRTGKGFEAEVVLREEDVPELRKILGDDSNGGDK